MTQTQGVAVTYTGRDDPFIDRLYRSGLTFTPGQSRIVPLTLAERFLRHADVFQRVKSAQELQTEAVAAQEAADAAKAASEALAKQQAEDAEKAARLAADQGRADADRAAQEAAEKAEAARLDAAAAAQREADANAKPKADQPADDTQALLDAAKQEQDAQRKNEEARFALLDQLEGMDKTALITWAQDKFKQKIPGNLGEEKVRERARGFVDQYGVP